MRAFIVYVRPLLEYGSCVWSPHFNQCNVVSQRDYVSWIICRTVDGWWLLV